MNSGGSNKIIIKVDSFAEQEEIIKTTNQRGVLRDVPKSLINKENILDRIRDPKLKLKTSNDSGIQHIEHKKRKPSAVHKSIQTEDDGCYKSEITEADLTLRENPGERYWEIVAEKRRVALDESLKENEELHLRLSMLEEELDSARQVIDESKGLVEVLSEMLTEQTEAANESAEATDKQYEVGESSNNESFVSVQDSSFTASESD